jgi:proteasome accessory factor B
MSAEKTERLINLTLGLLSSKRFLTKSEIFRSIAGYSGSAETMERMFERDKDELRGLGINIVVGTLDPLFQDEAGYLISSADFQFQPDDFTKEELLLMTMAGNVWRESALAEISQNALLKVASFDGAAGYEKVSASMISDNDFNLDQFKAVIDAISSRRMISFDYNGKARQVKPYGAKNIKGDWYLVGEDSKQIKIFKLLRFESGVLLSGDISSFELPADFEIDNYLNDKAPGKERSALLELRIGKANALRNRGSVLNEGSEWDELEISFEEVENFTKELLWFAEDVRVISPDDLRELMIEKLREGTNG